MTTSKPDRPPSLSKPELVKRLHGIASHFYSKPETADVTIIVPVPIAALPRSGRSSPSSIPASPTFAFARRSAVPLSSLLNASSSSSSASHSISHSSSHRLRSEGTPSQSSSSGVSSSAPSSTVSCASSVPTTPDVFEPQYTASTTPSSPSLTGSLLAIPRSCSAGVRRCSEPGVQMAAPIPATRSALSVPHSARLEAEGRATRAMSSASEEKRHLAFRVHRDYLVAQSTLFESLFDEAGPSREAVGSPTSSRQEETAPEVAADTSTSLLNSPSRRRSSIWSPSRDNRPRFLPKGSTKARALYLPLPDPSSFPAVLHYLYHGDFGALARMMEAGEARWDGLMVNADYLGLDARLREDLGVWWAQRRRRLAEPARQPMPCPRASMALQGFRFEAGASSCAGGGGGGDAARSMSRPNGDAKRSRDLDAECLSPRTVLSPLSSEGLSRRRSSNLAAATHAACDADEDQDDRRRFAAGPHDAAPQPARPATGRGGDDGAGDQADPKVVARGRTRAFTLLLNNLTERRNELAARPPGRLRSQTIGERGPAAAAPGRELPPLL
ncbi:uncharacterized protein PFL1_03976 [Pseudozyma flocculosa PF-1]|uniref:BTB domain-containing protein n=2 Tax=Pseudozyma flocculosa TaxID=84751 RepID=A0A5C3EXY1_9BASI|nr:uncharacterized protein PFL1_03976 [Pseudozyma flocculosa PF-1]EPQ28673.1 hypothetical protein PFL1_03976 [Pseudozyma flocculosa PF-1]SPO36625.1 uncharacterized protein PSFLO_02096 [Pseudozyma flocculosa]